MVGVNREVDLFFVGTDFLISEGSGSLKAFPSAVTMPVPVLRLTEILLSPIAEPEGIEISIISPVFSLWTQ